jgi:hypothetical protein
MILDTHTVINPLAVMIESFDAFIADVAVSRLRGTDDFTCRTQHVWIEFFYELKEGDFG